MNKTPILSKSDADWKRLDIVTNSVTSIHEVDY
jgi:hypothetical protein